jgi:hypothetical protein
MGILHGKSALVRATGCERVPTARCYWVIEGKLLAGAYPGALDAREHALRVAALWNAGIRTFISLMEANETDNSKLPFAPYAPALQALARSSEPASEHELAFQRFAIVDLSAPSMDLMVQIVSAIDAALEQGRPAYVHCFGGIGRTGTTVCAWLLHRRLATAASVFQVLDDLRRADAFAGKRPAPENPVQRAFVKAWSERV